MPNYTYKGKDRRGMPVQGEILAHTDEAALSKLTKDGITIRHIKEVGPDLSVMEFARLALGIGRPKLEDLLMFARQMYTLTRAGVPMIRCIKVIAEATNNEGLKDALNKVVLALESGKSLGAAMKEHPIIFPGLMVSMIEVGENTGNLDEAFAQIAFYVENEIDTRKRIKSATRYPMFVFGTIFAAIMVINIWVIPSFADFFTKFGGELPVPTKILMASSDFTLAYWPFLLVGIIGAVVGFLFYIRTDAGELRWSQFILKVPLIGKILEKALLARFCRSFAMTLKAGVPMLQSLAVVSKAVDNAYVGQKVLDMRASLERGESLVRAALSTGMFTNLVVQMIAIGEETGDVDGMLQEVAECYERDVDYDLKGLSEAIEPILISIIAVIVLILALGVFLPMWDLSSVALK